MSMRLGGGFDRGDQLEVVLERVGRRHEDIEHAVARLGAHRGARDLGGGLCSEAGARPARRRHRVALRAGARSARWFAPTHFTPRATAGGSRRARGSGARRRHRIRSDDVRIVALLDPRLRIERQAIAERRIAGNQVAALAAQEPVSRSASGCRTRRAPPAARGRRRRRGPARTPARAARAPAGLRASTRTDRRSTAGAARATGNRTRLRTPANTYSRRQAEPLGDAGEKHAGDFAPSTPRSLLLVVEQRRVRARSARRRGARSSSATSAATARPDTTCPGRSATGPAARTSRLSRLYSSTASRRLFGPSAAVFHSAPSGSSTDTNVGSPPMVRRTSPRQQLRVDVVAERLDLGPLLFGVRLGDARRFPDALHLHVVLELDFGLRRPRR